MNRNSRTLPGRVFHSQPPSPASPRVPLIFPDKFCSKQAFFLSPKALFPFLPTDLCPSAPQPSSWHAFLDLPFWGKPSRPTSGPPGMRPSFPSRPGPARTAPGAGGAGCGLEQPGKEGVGGVWRASEGLCCRGASLFPSASLAGPQNSWLSCGALGERRGINSS